MRNKTMVSLFVSFMILCVGVSASAQPLQDLFQVPPRSARPGVYWYFMDGNQDRDEMTADLESMDRVGLGSILFLEVNIGVPRGPVDFMSEQWQDNFAHAVKTTERLGMEFILGTGPGWSGSGGPWVEPEQSMQHLTGEVVHVQGPQLFEQQLPVPEPLEPNRFSGMSKELLETRRQWYRDVAVLAYPAPRPDMAVIELKDIKTLKDVLPYSIRLTETRFVPMAAAYEEPPVFSVLDPDAVIDLTGKMQPDGTLRWDVPEGNWTIFRFAARSTGQTTRPAPTPGHGFECDKFSAEAYRHHWNNFQAKLLEKVQPGQDQRGWTRIHLDSWEMSSQNWTAGFRQEFIKRRGYDPKPWYPAFQGHVVGSLEKTERFLWDMRKTAQELVIENHAQVIKDIAHKHGMVYSNEPYDMNPAGDIDLGSVADIPMCEFWEHRHGHDTLYSCLEAVSIAHVMGRSTVEAEAFTARPPIRYDKFPGNMKNQLDWAFAIGINGIMFHTFQHQPLGPDIKPGMHMGPYGVSWHRNQTWWDMLPAFHRYIARCSYLLRQGTAVADILYLTPEGVPHIFLPPDSAMEGSGNMADKKGYSFDAVTPRILMQRAAIKDGYVAFPGGSRYRLLVLPNAETMTPETLDKIAEFIKQGAAVVGNPPRKSPSLVNYPKCDQRVSERAKEIWGGLDIPEHETVRRYGKGTIFWGGQWSAAENPSAEDALYPHYRATASVLERLGLCEDFRDEKNVLRFIHRQTDAEHLYFVSNRTAEFHDVDCTFRVTGLKPALWHPETGHCRALPRYTAGRDTTTIPLRFAPFESYFVVFRQQVENADHAQENFPIWTTVATLEGPWSVSFDPVWGGPSDIEFPKLLDWRDHDNRGIKYYSGTAVYRKTFDCPADIKPNDQLILDLGQLYEMARVTLNGKELGVVWTAPYQISLGDALKPTGNQLVIEVANSWENRLIGDKTPEDKEVRTVQWDSGLLEGKPYQTGRYTFTTFNRRSNETLLPSGLIGPVTLKTSKDSYR